MRIGSWNFFDKRIISDDPTDPLMIRYRLLRTPSFGIFIHKFCRSDHDRCLHDHPWDYLAIILKGGYWEIMDDDRGAQRRPGNILYRPATWRHRVVLQPGKTSWSLTFVSGRKRRWGFWPNGQWCWWRKYNPYTGICEEEVIYEGNND